MKKMFFSFIIAIFFLSFIPTFDAHAQTVDGRCFKKSECVARRTTIYGGGPSAESGFVQNAETAIACGKGTETDSLGFCLPIGTTETKIGFGGKRTFNDLGDFIRYMYRFSIVIAAIISIVMIIISGMQWATSGGNSSIIGDAKKRIEGSLTGLILVVLSYSILNFINPNLVNLRLPQTWLINTIEVPKTEFCGTGIGEEKTKFSLFKEQHQTPSDAQVKELTQKANYSLLREQTLCTNIYLVEKGAGSTCQGSTCSEKPEETTCAFMPQGGNGGKKETRCYDGQVVITMKTGSGNLSLLEDWDFPWSNAEAMHALCAKGNTFFVSETPTNYGDMRTPQQIHFFGFKVDGGIQNIETKINNTCGGTTPDKFKGFYFTFEMDENNDPIDETHWIGRHPKSFQLRDLGDSTAWEYIKPQIKPDFLFSLDELKNHLRLTVNATDIYDFDDNELLGTKAKTIRTAIYGALGIVQ